MAANIAWIRKSEESRLLLKERQLDAASLDGLIFDLFRRPNRQKHFEALFTVYTA